MSGETSAGASASLEKEKPKQDLIKEHISSIFFPSHAQNPRFSASGPKCTEERTSDKPWGDEERKVACEDPFTAFNEVGRRVDSKETGIVIT